MAGDLGNFTSHGQVSANNKPPIVLPSLSSTPSAIAFAPCGCADFTNNIDKLHPCATPCYTLHDSLFSVRLIASLVYSPCSELKLTLMDVERQSDGSDCGVLAIVSSAVVTARFP